MAWNLLQTKTSSKTASAGTTSTASLSTTTSGSLVLVCCTTDSGTNSISSISCSGMSFAKVTSSLVAGGTYDVELWYAYNITGQTTPTLTINYVAGAIGGGIIREYSGAITTDPLDKQTIATTTTASMSSGATAALVGKDDLVIGFAGTGDSGNTYTAGSLYANATTLKIGTTVDMGMEDKILTDDTSAQTATFKITNVSNGACGVATFKMQPYNVPVGWLIA